MLESLCGACRDHPGTLGLLARNLNIDCSSVASVLLSNVRSFAAASLNVGAGAALLLTPFVFDSNPTQMVSSILCSWALIVLALPRGAIRQRYGGWEQHVH
jgi:hypothetical protein